MPEGWSNKSIGELCRFSNGYGFRPSDWSKRGLPIIRIQNLNGSKEFNYFEGVTDPSWLVEPGTILFAWAGMPGVSFGPTIWNGPQGVLNQHIYRVHPYKNVEPLWLYLALEIATKNIEQNAHGFKTTLLHVRKEEIASQVVPVPPLPEQAAIATALSDVDALLTSLDRLIAKKRDIKQATMQQLLTGRTRLPGFSNASDMSYKQTDMGVFPSDWGSVLLGSVSAFITKGATPTTYGFNWVSDGILFLRSECVSEEGLDLNQSTFITKEAHNILKRSEVHAGDILITITGNVGRVIYLDSSFRSANINQHIARIRINNADIVSGYIFYFLSQPEIRLYYNSIVTGQAYPQISLKQVRDTKIFLPPTKKEQQAIATILSDMDAEIAALEQKRDKTRALKQGMMQELLSGRIRLV